MCIVTFHIWAPSVNRRKLWLWKLPVIFSYHILTSCRNFPLHIHVCVRCASFYWCQSRILLYYSPFSIYYFGYINFVDSFAFSHNIISFLILQSSLTKITKLSKRQRTKRDTPTMNRSDPAIWNGPIRLWKILKLPLIWAKHIIIQYYCTCYRGFTALLWAAPFFSIVIPWFSLMFKFFTLFFFLHLFLLHSSSTISFSLFTAHILLALLFHIIECNFASYCFPCGCAMQRLVNSIYLP